MLIGSEAPALPTRLCPPSQAPHLTCQLLQGLQDLYSVLSSIRPWPWTRWDQLGSRLLPQTPWTASKVAKRNWHLGSGGYVVQPAHPSPRQGQEGCRAPPRTPPQPFSPRRFIVFLITQVIWGEVGVLLWLHSLQCYLDFLQKPCVKYYLNNYFKHFV